MEGGFEQQIVAIKIVRRLLATPALKPSMSVTRPRRIRGKSGRWFEFDAQKLSGMRASSPCELRRLLKGDLDNVVLVGLHKQESRRYPSVHEMSNDLFRHLEGKRVVASAANPAYLATRFARKRPLVVYAAALLAVAVAANIFWVDSMRQMSAAAEGDRQVLNGDLCRLAGALRVEVRPWVPQAEALVEGIEARARCK